MKNRFQEEQIDLLLIFKRILANWPFFILTIFLALTLAYIFNSITPRTYQIEGSIQIDKGKNRSRNLEEFLMDNRANIQETALEDEIGILSSFNLISQTLQRLNFGISYFTKEKVWNFLSFGYKHNEQFYNTSYKIHLDSTKHQILHVPIHIKLLPRERYRVTAKAKNIQLYDVKRNQIVLQNIPLIDIDKTLSISEPFESKYLNFKIEVNPHIPPSEHETYFIINSINGISESFQNGLGISAISRGSNILKLSVEGSCPDKLKVFVDELMLSYILKDQTKKTGVNKKTLEYIEKQIGDINNLLKEAENNLQTFKAQNKVIGQDILETNYLTRLDRLETEKSDISGNINFLNKMLEDINNMDDIVKYASITPENIDNPALYDLIVELSELSREKSGMEYSAKKSNPALQVLELKVNRTTEQLKNTILNIISSNEIRLNELNNRIANINNEINKLPINEKELMGLERQLVFLDKKHEYWMNKKAEAEITLAANTSENQIIDYARITANSPISPQPKKTYLLSIFIGLLAPAFLIVVKDRINKKIQSKGDLHSVSNKPILGVLPYAKKHTPLSLIEKPKSAISESFRTLYFNIIHDEKILNPKVILLTSLIPNEGKTFCAQNLAAILALSGKKTLLLSLDLRKPKAHLNLNINNKIGISDFLRNKVQLHEITISSEIENLFVMPAGPPPSNPSNLISTKRMESLIQISRNNFDYIIIDSPPINLVSDSLILQHFSDLNLFVARKGYTPQNLIENSDILNGNKSFKNTWLILNGIRVSKHYNYYEK
ncbi:GumC family protein [Xanthovirga aplysinae]|uniref:GumC family protein n=1 Tax=Xanthovirga aplysinae TaxID=2529853 RepID=UPI0012BC3874|nr:tyrosine-protein kinase family protein [Xanthovirga aplysinae]MTI31902.1 polysaccharide biosynthesis tyrosine autokinase [Xanthovirga aplysinae]